MLFPEPGEIAIFFTILSRSPNTLTASNPKRSFTSSQHSFNVSSFSTVVAAASFKVEGSTYYAYYARPIHGFQNDVMDICIVLDSDGKIANIDVKQYFYGHVEYFAPANSFNSSSYESGLIGLTSETYHGYETVVSGATHTSKAIETAIRNTLTEFNRIK